MTDVPNPLNIRNIRLIAGGPGGQKARAMFGKQALQMLKQGHLANAPLPQWRMRRYVSDDKGNVVLINIKSTFGLDTIEFLSPPETPKMERRVQTEYFSADEHPGGRREFFPAIRVWTGDGKQVGFIISRKSDSLEPPWDVIPLPSENGNGRLTESEAGLTDWRQGQYSRPDSPYEGRDHPYPEADTRWVYVIDLSIPTHKDELWIYRDVDPKHDRSFVDVDWEAIDPVHVNRPPLPGYRWEWTGSYYLYYHAPHGSHYYVSGLKPAFWDYGAYIRTGIALGDGSGTGTPTADIFRQMSGFINTVGGGLCSNFNNFILKEAFDTDPEVWDYWWAVHDPFNLNPPRSQWEQLVPSHTNVGWWSGIINEQRIGTTMSHNMASTLSGPSLYTHDFYGTWANEGFALLQVHISHLTVTLSERKFYPGVVTNYPWDLCSFTKENPCFQEYAACSLQERLLAYDSERTVIDDPTNYSEYFEVDNVMHLIGSGSITPPSEYASLPGLRIQNCNPRYYKTPDEAVRAFLPLRRDQFKVFEYHYFIHSADGGTESSKVEFPGYTYIPVGDQGSAFMHTVTGEVYLHGEPFPETLYGNASVRVFEKIVLEMTYEERRILFDGDGPPQFSKKSGR